MLGLSVCFQLACVECIKCGNNTDRDDSLCPSESYNESSSLKSVCVFVCVCAYVRQEEVIIQYRMRDISVNCFVQWKYVCVCAFNSSAFLQIGCAKVLNGDVYIEADGM